MWDFILNEQQKMLSQKGAKKLKIPHTHAYLQKCILKTLHPPFSPLTTPFWVLYIAHFNSRMYWVTSILIGPLSLHFSLFFHGFSFDSVRSQKSLIPHQWRIQDSGSNDSKLCFGGKLKNISGNLKFQTVSKKLI